MEKLSRNQELRVRYFGHYYPIQSINFIDNGTVIVIYRDELTGSRTITFDHIGEFSENVKPVLRGTK